MRASYIIKSTQNVEKNSILEKLEDYVKGLFEYSILSKFKGFGLLSITTTLMSMGMYDKVPTGGFF